MVEFLNLLQEGMSFHDYPFKFTKLLKYSPSLVSDPRDEMSHFVTEMLDDFQEECHSVMLHDKMNISRLMVHALNMEEARDKRKSRDAKRPRSFDGDSSNNGLEIQDSLYLRRGFLIKFLPSSLRQVVIGCLTVSLRKENLLVHKSRSQLVESVARSTMVIDLRGYTGLLVVVKRGTGLGIFLMLGVNTMVVVNLMQVVQMRLQKRTTSMLSSLGVSKRLLPTS